MRLKSVIRKNKSVSYTLPAPIKGLNVRDNPADMDVGYAVVMDNYIPSDTKVVLRSGYVEYVGLPEKVYTLAEYKNGDNDVFLAISGGSLYNISSAKNVYQYAHEALNNGRCITRQYKNYLYFVSGNDVPKVYYIDDDGTEHFSDWEFSADNLEPSRIVNVNVSKQRLWFIEKGTMKVWYPETAGNIAGALNYFDFSSVARFGGELVAVANWTQDGGEGIDDLTVFITSQGEALVYAGQNINNADDWTLKGSFKISRPIGYNCILDYQGDIVVISEDGYIPLSGALPLERANSSQIAFSDTIRSLVLDRTAKNSGKAGWQGIIYGRGGYGLFNVPVANQFEQHVINLNSGAWCRFTNIRSYCWCEYNQRLYFGSDNGVYLFDEGYSDNGTPICGHIEQAATNLGTNNLKKIQLINPRTKSSSGYSLVIYLNMDFESQKIDYLEQIVQSGNNKWGTVKWSNSQKPLGVYWANCGNTTIRSQWIACSATGYKAGVVFKTKTSGNRIEWYETGIRYEIGNGIL